MPDEKKELETKLEKLQEDLSGFLVKAKEQQESLGAITSELKEKIESVQNQVDAIDKKLVDASRPPAESLSFAQYMKENDEIQKFFRKERGHLAFEISLKHMSELEQKTLITSSAVGSATSGVIQIDRERGIVPEARQELTMRSVLTARPTALPQIDFIKVNSALSKGSPQTEGSEKLENAVTFTTATANVRTLATWIPATVQILEDFDELLGFLQTSLPYYVRVEEEQQILSGDNTGQNLNGLITQAQAFDTSLLVAAAGYTRIDCIARAVQQTQADKELMPTFIVVHPNDYWSIRLTKDSNGNYILGSPQMPGVGNIWGLMPVVTTHITAGTFLTGSGNPVAAEIRDRSGLVVEMSREHSDFFTKNKVAIRCEERLTLVVKRPDSYVTGSFATSPSS